MNDYFNDHIEDVVEHHSNTLNDFTQQLDEKKNQKKKWLVKTDKNPAGRGPFAQPFSSSSGMEIELVASGSDGADGSGGSSGSWSVLIGNRTTIIASCSGRNHLLGDHTKSGGLGGWARG